MVLKSLLTNHRKLAFPNKIIYIGHTLILRFFFTTKYFISLRYGRWFWLFQFISIDLILIAFTFYITTNYNLYFLRYLNDLYTLDLSQHDNLQWDVPCTYGQPPTPRESHSAVLHTAENGKHPRLFIYGGMSGCRLADVYILDVGKSWQFIISCIFMYLIKLNGKENERN